MVSYLVLIVLIVFLALLIKPETKLQNKRLFCIIAFGAIAVMAGIRDASVGVDTIQYCRTFIKVTFLPFSALSEERYELGFLYFCKALSYISTNYQILLVVSSAVIIAAVGYFVYKRSKNVLMSAILFITLNYFFSYLNIMREAMAIAIVLIGLVKLFEEKRAAFVIAVILACLFHRSALIALLLWPISYSEFNKKSLLVYLLVGVVGFVFIAQITDGVAFLMGRDTFYAEAHMGSNYFGALIQFAFASFIFLLCSNYLQLQKRNNTGNSYEQTLIQHMLILWVIFCALGMQIEVLSRLGYYFSIVSIIAIPLACRADFILMKEMTLVQWIILGVSFAYFFIVGTLRPEWYGAIPYVSDWSNVMLMLESIFS